MTEMGWRAAAERDTDLAPRVSEDLSALDAPLVVRAPAWRAIFQAEHMIEDGA
jgi:hypothetical protein